MRVSIDSVYRFLVIEELVKDYRIFLYRYLCVFLGDYYLTGEILSAFQSYKIKTLATISGISLGNFYAIGIFPGRLKNRV